MAILNPGWENKTLFNWSSDQPSYNGLDFAANPVYTDVFDSATGYNVPSSMSSYDGGVGSDPATTRAINSAIDTGISATKAGFTRSALNAGVHTLVNGSPNYSSALSSFMSAFSPMSIATSGMSGMYNSAMGLDSSPISGLGASLLGMALGNPAIGVFGGMLSSTLGEGIGKMLGTRTNEKLKSVIDRTYNSGFLESARIARDISDYSDMYNSISPADVLGDGTVLNKSQAEINRDALASAAFDVTSVMRENDRFGKVTMADPFAPSISIPGISLTPYADVDAPAIYQNIDPFVAAYRDAENSANPSGWNGNINSMSNPYSSGIVAAGLAGTLSPAAVRAFNMSYSPMNLGDISGAINALAIDRAQRAAFDADTGIAGGHASYGSNFDASNKGWGFGPSRSDTGGTSGTGGDTGGSSVGSGDTGGHTHGMGDAGAGMGSGGDGAGSGRVICTELVRQGKMSKRLLKYEELYTLRHYPTYAIRGYHFWAVPFVRLMQKYAWVTKLAETCIWRAEEIAFKLGKRKKGNWKGAIVRAIIEPPCFLIGPFIKYDKADKRWDRKDSERLLDKGDN